MRRGSPGKLVEPVLLIWNVRSGIFSSSISLYVVSLVMLIRTSSYISLEYTHSHFLALKESSWISQERFEILTVAAYQLANKRICLSVLT